ncbi:MAG: hypothetical protein K940chlam7_01924 [Chlamydiae bacterium]|nr:hypothetical protein [Chlamydiota bacterium]
MSSVFFSVAEYLGSLVTSGPSLTGYKLSKQSDHVLQRVADVSTAHVKTVSGPQTTVTTSASGSISWGKRITACVLGGLLLSSGKTWGVRNPSGDPCSDKLATMKGMLDSVAYRAALVFEISAITMAVREREGTLSTALIAGMMLLPKAVQGQSLCPQFAGALHTLDIAYDVTISGNYAHLSDGWPGFMIIDVSNPATPKVAGVYDVGRAEDIAVSGNYSYIADSEAFGLQIADISNVAAPRIVGFYNTPDRAHRVALSGQYAYVLDGSGLRVIDVSNVVAPVLVGSYNTAGAYDVALSGQYAYVVDSSGLQIIDISNVAVPILVGSYTTSDIAIEVALSGQYAYVAAGSSGLLIVNVSNVANPTLAGSYNTPGSAWGIALSGNLAYVADGTSTDLQIIDVSNVSSPVFAGSFDTPYLVRGVDVSSDYAYMAIQNFGLYIIKLSCPTSSSSSTQTLSDVFSDMTKTTSNRNSEEMQTSMVSLSSSISPIKKESNLLPVVALIVSVITGIGVGISYGLLYILNRQQKKRGDEIELASPDKVGSEVERGNDADFSHELEYANVPFGSIRKKNYANFPPSN